jgi:hypothetical protein
MPILDTQCIRVIEKLPGWRGRIFHSPSLTFGHWDFIADSSIHDHVHPQEEVWELLEGTLELTIGQREPSIDNFFGKVILFRFWHPSVLFVSSTKRGQDIGPIG